MCSFIMFCTRWRLQMTARLQCSASHIGTNMYFLAKMSTFLVHYRYKIWVLLLVWLLDSLSDLAAFLSPWSSSPRWSFLVACSLASTSDMSWTYRYRSWSFECRQSSQGIYKMRGIYLLEIEVDYDIIEVNARLESHEVSFVDDYFLFSVTTHVLHFADRICVLHVWN